MASSINETYWKYFDKHGLKNIFLPLYNLSNVQTKNWIAKSIQEIDRFSNYVVLIDKHEKESVDKFTLYSLHESLAASSVSITFCIFNIFSLITNTDPSFFDEHIMDYFRNKTKLNSYEMNLLSFNWHTAIESINALTYSTDEKLWVYKRDSLIGFKILNFKIKESYFNTRERNEFKMIYSKEYFIKDLLYILSTIDLLASLLSYKKNSCKLNGSLPVYSYIEIENINDFMVISENILSRS